MLPFTVTRRQPMRGRLTRIPTNGRVIAKMVIFTNFRITVVNNFIESRKKLHQNITMDVIPKLLKTSSSKHTENTNKIYKNVIFVR
jgi:hypothetical protein